MIRKMWKRIRNLADRPFASALAFLLFSSMLVQLLGLSLAADALSELVSEWLLNLLSFTYGIAGAMLLVGLMWKRADYEAAGCAIALSGLLIRMVALLTVLGFTTATVSNAVFYLAFAWACVERIKQIVIGERIIRVNPEVKIRFKEEGE